MLTKQRIFHTSDIVSSKWERQETAINRYMIKSVNFQQRKRRYQFTNVYDLSNYVLKDKLFFFVHYWIFLTSLNDLHEE